jgi:ubiquinone/menaquinone biosynthesis C-methylase UbiE
MQEWDTYWAKDQKAYNTIYDSVAVFYRRYIIKPYLRRYCNKYFTNDSVILHAGCGSGQVEKGFDKSFTIIGMDISRNALSLYCKCHECSNLILGDITMIGIKDETIDGIYNLGVMEHFSEDEIHTIFREFHRIVKRKGVVVVFWPPKFGLTVITLRFWHFFLNSLLRKNVHLHPTEPSLIKSRAHVERIVKKAGFHLKETNFSLADAYTYMVIVMEKKD